ncbi:MAG: transmembrane 220 family protein [Acidobacteriota bacterium]|nr:transmembrane 220 family protein [Acidobacteriota bacterium]
MKATTPLQRVVGYVVLGAGMAIFGALQFNDPDSFLWAALYAAAAALFAGALAGWHRPWTIGLVLLVYVGVGATVFPGFLDLLQNHSLSDLAGVMSTDRQFIEDSREFLGLVIAATALVWLWRMPPEP